jgi:hypothetical protein
MVGVVTTELEESQAQSYGCMREIVTVASTPSSDCDLEALSLNNFMPTVMSGFSVGVARTAADVASLGRCLLQVTISRAISCQRHVGRAPSRPTNNNVVMHSL